MNTATEIKNVSSNEADVVAASNSGTNTNEDSVTIRIPQKITLELPRSFSFEIPKWVGPTLITVGIVTLLSIVTRGAIWHFWWLIFCMPWFWGGYSCGTKKGKSGRNEDQNHSQGYGWKNERSSKKPAKRSEPTPTSEMYV